MAGTIRTKLGQILHESGIVDNDTIERALEIQESEPVLQRRKIGDILVSEFSVDRDLVYSEIARVFDFRKIVLNGKEIENGRLSFINNLVEKLDMKYREVLLNQKILPYAEDPSRKDVLHILAADPTDKHIPELALQMGYTKFEVAYTPLTDIEKVLEKIAPQQNEFLQLLEDVEELNISQAPAEERIDEEDIDAEIHQSKLTNLVEGVLIEAVRLGASDIHIVPDENNRTVFHFRVNGRLKKWHVQENTRSEAISAVFKDRTKNVDRFERESAQDGFIQREIDGYKIRFRVSILPLVGTEYHKKLESIVIRILDDRNVITDLSELGLQDQARRDFINAISRPQGIVILTGPTGSGKSTTLVAGLHHVFDPSLNLLTVEDPVEYIIKGVRQLKIGNKMNFDQAVRSILRHDPDIVMVGEMRDLKTAEIAIKLANTGHLTFSTLHTNDAPSAVSRLFKMGVEPFLIANAINIVVAQRLIRKLCDTCKTPVDDINPSIPAALGFSKQDIAEMQFYEPGGCDNCTEGYSGRVAIHEALLFTREIRNMIIDASDKIDEDSLRDTAVNNGMMTLRISGAERVRQGITTCQEVLHATVEE